MPIDKSLESRDQIFISYCHTDRKWLEKLRVHLAPYLRNHMISVWDDTQIKIGAKWRAEIQAALERAKLAVLLVTPEFLASQFIADNELPPLLRAAESDGLVILWIPIRASAFTETPIAAYQAASDPAEPLASLTISMQARHMVRICKDIKSALPQSRNIVPSLSPVDSSSMVAEGKSPPIKNGETGFPVPKVPSPCDDYDAEASSVIRPAVLLSQTEMGTLFYGNHSEFGKVVLKILQDIPNESRNWIYSDQYDAVVRGRLLQKGTFPSGRSYLLFSYVEGVALSDVVDYGNVIAGALLDSIILQIIEHLVDLHSRGVIHRDVTPGNVILTPNFETGQCDVTLIDYESACSTTDTQTAIRTHGFTPPEQEDAHAVLSSDLYSLASTAYFLSSGRMPPDRSTSVGIRAAFPVEAFGRETRLSETGGQDKLLKSWFPKASDRPKSALEFVRFYKSGTSKRLPPSVYLGKFTTGQGWNVELFDQYHRVVRAFPNE